jgi:opacity protein-like surface antigen
LGLLSNSEATASGFTLTDFMEYKSGIPLSLAVGVKSDDYRVEGAIGYQSHTVDKMASTAVTTDDSVLLLSFMANGYRDFSIKNSKVSPYLMAGIGLMSVKPTDVDATTGFAWQIGTGVGIKASERITVDFGYRYFNAANYTVNNATTGSVDLNVAGSNLLAGVRYGF